MAKLNTTLFVPFDNRGNHVLKSIRSENDIPIYEFNDHLYYEGMETHNGRTCVIWEGTHPRKKYRSSLKFLHGILSNNNDAKMDVGYLYDSNTFRIYGTFTFKEVRGLIYLIAIKKPL